MTTTVIPMTSKRAVYTVAEVSHMLSLSRGNTYAMVRSGDIPSMRVGHRWLIPKARFDAWLNGLPSATEEDFAVDQRRNSRLGIYHGTSA